MEVKIIPTGGHCNRLRAIATGVAVAKKYHCPSVIYWNNSLGLKADYCELFKPIPQDDIQRRIDEVKESLKSKYPNRIITLMDDTDRNSLEGMKFAVLDLFCLSKTKKILGSVGSSYSQIAAEIGGIEVNYAK